MGVALFVLPHYTHPGQIFCTQVLLAIGNGLSTNVSNTYLAKFAPKGQAARTLSWGTMADTMANIIGPFLTQLYLIDSTWPFYIAAFFAWLSTLSLLILGCWKSHGHHSHSETKETVENYTDAVAEAQEELKPKAEALNEPLLPAAQIHPAFLRCSRDPEHTLEHSVAMAEMAQIFYDDMFEKNHMYPFHASKPAVRRRAVQLHREMLQAQIPSIRAPSDADGDFGFRTDVAKFMIQYGHSDWAERIPGIDVDDITKQFAVPM